MIERHWKGIAKSGEANNYIHHLRTETFPAVSKIRGFIRASIVSREVDRGREFLIVTVWESLDAIREFAGEHIDQAVVPETVRRIMVEYEEKASHYVK